MADTKSMWRAAVTPLSLSTPMITPESVNELYNYLLEDAILGICFKIHRSCKLGYSNLRFPTHLDSSSDSDHELFVGITEPVYPAFCIKCKKTWKAEEFSMHLNSCWKLGLKNLRKKDKPVANSGLAANADKDSTTTNNNQKNPKPRVRKPPSVTLASLQRMSLERRKEFFLQKCGSILKAGKKLCMNSPKCSQHSPEQKQAIRDRFLGLY